jgi:hypothetical protein
VTAQHYVSVDTTREAELADLRTRLASAHSQIVGAATSAEHRVALVDELRTIGRLLDEPDPDGAAIGGRWRSVLGTTAVLGESVAAAAITVLVRSLFGSG